uniref:FCP1 homology domain-containing protein n=1 Tax=viral metagenome TaxID=1070528 RepID=A0A6C0B020_9ZZZZ|tara:strand:+ start:1336 stop:2148 length:813 start_codon:yes stop_codon:yes gene_type:complete
MQDNEMKVVVFDLDETLGQFIELGMFCDAIEHYNKRKLNFDEFYQIMEIFPEFIRPNILKILSYLKSKKQTGQCNKILIYTNNQGPKEWAENIKKYFEKKLDYKLFDQVIGAYKVNGKIIEKKRTTHNKSINDLLNCANLPESSKICFLDDIYHPMMEYNNVYYINMKPYTNYIPFYNMAERYYKYNSNIISDKSIFSKFIVNEMNKFKLRKPKKSLNEIINDEYIGKEIMEYLRDFFKKYNKRKTKKLNKKQKKKKKNNITLKNREKEG